MQGMFSSVGISDKITFHQEFSLCIQVLPTMTFDIHFLPPSIPSCMRFQHSLPSDASKKFHLNYENLINLIAARRFLRLGAIIKNKFFIGAKGGGRRRGERKLNWISAHKFHFHTHTPLLRGENFRRLSIVINEFGIAANAHKILSSVSNLWIISMPSSFVCWKWWGKIISQVNSMLFSLERF